MYIYSTILDVVYCKVVYYKNYLKEGYAHINLLNKSHQACYL